mmetsp:Transcript_113085/g.259136  ORF Transcript_113085/g.259136 Transcript_113085/m.259136 type:complete len:278 (-) Transcript_113085:341-1174(-)
MRLKCIDVDFGIRSKNRRMPRRKSASGWCSFSAIGHPCSDCPITTGTPCNAPPGHWDFARGCQTKCPGFGVPRRVAFSPVVSSSEPCCCCSGSSSGAACGKAAAATAVQATGTVRSIRLDQHACCAAGTGAALGVGRSAVFTGKPAHCPASMGTPRGGHSGTSCKSPPERLWRNRDAPGSPGWWERQPGAPCRRGVSQPPVAGRAWVVSNGQRPAAFCDYGLQSGSCAAQAPAAEQEGGRGRNSGESPLKTPASSGCCTAAARLGPSASPEFTAAGG